MTFKYLAYVSPLYYFALLILQFIFFSAPLLAGTFYHPAIGHVTKLDVV